MPAVGLSDQSLWDGVRSVAIQKSNVLSTEGREPLMPDFDRQLLADATNQRRRPLSPAYIPVDEYRGKTIQQAIVEKCRNDPAYFIFGGFVRTFDPHDRENPYKPFPDKPFLREALAFIHQPSEVAAIAKSRQMMISWLLCAYAVWEAHFHPSRVCMIQSRVAEDAYEFVFFNDWRSSRCGFIEEALPPYLWVNDGGKYLQAMRGRLIYPWGSKIVAVPGGAHHFRSRVASFAVIDEACFFLDFGDSFKAALAMVKGGGKLRVVSSAKYGSYFGKLIEAEKNQNMAA